MLFLDGVYTFEGRRPTFHRAPRPTLTERQGWEIDHIKPESKGGSDAVRNLQAMQTKKNRELGDSLRKRSRHKQ